MPANNQGLFSRKANHTHERKDVDVIPFDGYILVKHRNDQCQKDALVKALRSRQNRAERDSSYKNLMFSNYRKKDEYASPNTVMVTFKENPVDVQDDKLDAELLNATEEFLSLRHVRQPLEIRPDIQPRVMPTKSAAELASFEILQKALNNLDQEHARLLEEKAYLESGLPALADKINEYQSKVTTFDSLNLQDELTEAEIDLKNQQHTQTSEATLKVHLSQQLNLLYESYAANSNMSFAEVYVHIGADEVNAYLATCKQHYLAAQESQVSALKDKVASLRELVLQQVDARATLTYYQNSYKKIQDAIFELDKRIVMASHQQTVLQTNYDRKRYLKKGYQQVLFQSITETPQSIASAPENQYLTNNN